MCRFGLLGSVLVLLLLLRRGTAWEAEGEFNFRFKLLDDCACTIRLCFFTGFVCTTEHDIKDTRLNTVQRCSGEKGQQIFTFQYWLPLVEDIKWKMNVTLHCPSRRQPFGQRPNKKVYPIFPLLPTYNLTVKPEYEEIPRDWVRELNIFGFIHCPVAISKSKCLDMCTNHNCPKDTECFANRSSAECGCNPVLCGGHGECSVVEESIHCDCEGGFEGQRCEDKVTWIPTTAPEPTATAPARPSRTTARFAKVEEKPKWSLPVIVAASTSAAGAFVLVIVVIVCCASRRKKTRKLQINNDDLEGLPSLLRVYRVAYNLLPSEYADAESLYEDPETYAYADTYEEPDQPYSNAIYVNRSAAGPAAPPLPERSSAKRPTKPQSKVFVRPKTDSETSFQ